MLKAQSLSMESVRSRVEVASQKRAVFNALTYTYMLFEKDETPVWDNLNSWREVQGNES